MRINDIFKSNIEKRDRVRERKEKYLFKFEMFHSNEKLIVSNMKGDA